MRRLLALFIIMALCLTSYIGKKAYETRAGNRTVPTPGRRSQTEHQSDQTVEQFTVENEGHFMSQVHLQTSVNHVNGRKVGRSMAQVLTTDITRKDGYTPVLSQSHYLPRKPDTLTRLASEFVDEKLLSTCPSGSVMVSKELQEAIPLHNDCPEVFIIGVRKGGTTAMLQYLSKHPHFEGALLNATRHIGETFYFSDLYMRKNKTWMWYLSLFPANGTSGESSVNYFTNCNVPRLIWTNCGRRSKIVVLLRNPVDRFESHFLMRVHGPSYMRNKGVKYNDNIKAFVKTEYISVSTKLLQVGGIGQVPSVELMQTGWSKFVCLYRAGKCIFEGYYYVHLMNWLCNFPSENILILNSEEFYRDTAYAVNQVMEFLSLAPLTEEYLKNVTSKAYNAGHHEDRALRHRLDTADKKLIRKVYRYSNEALLNLLNWKHIDW